MSQRLTLGSLETVSIPSLGVSDVLAKVDTGAFSGALHCTHIREEDGTLYFTPLGNPDLATSTDVYDQRHVRSASGHKMSRYIVPVTFLIQGKEYPTLIGLTDRAVMRREILLGRRFLIEHEVIVDVTLSKQHDDEAESFEA
jgi:hypothetical protein